MQGEDNQYDFLKENLQHSNKQRYLDNAKETIKKQESIGQLEIQQKIIEQYQDTYIKFMHGNTLLSETKSCNFIEECLNSVHPGLKAKRNCKTILSILSKIFVQQMIEQSLQIVQEQNAQQIDLDILQQAYRRKNMKKQIFHNLNAIIR